MVTKIKKILPSKVNKEIVKILQNTPGWYFGYDEKEEDNNFNKDQGLALQTFNEEVIAHPNYQTLNMFAFIIANKICDELSMTFNKLQRVNYNFYHPLSIGKPHTDYSNDNFYSILYNLNTNDGYTKIQEEKFISNESEALLFKSNQIHFGCGPTNGLRYNLNIIFS
jgi:hypothetical protein|tara:strand:- start:673 stop:1173 length:501 start_codon:yes stop_codon:yes gene_type:complete